MFKPLKNCVKILPKELDTIMENLHIYTGEGTIVDGEGTGNEIIFPLRGNFSHEEDGVLYYYSHVESIVAVKEDGIYQPTIGYVKIRMPEQTNEFTKRDDKGGWVEGVGNNTTGLEIGQEVIFTHPTVFRVKEDGKEYTYVCQNDILCTS